MSSADYFDTVLNTPSTTTSNNTTVSAAPIADSSTFNSTFLALLEDFHNHSSNLPDSHGFVAAHTALRSHVLSYPGTNTTLFPIFDPLDEDVVRKALAWLFMEFVQHTPFAVAEIKKFIDAIFELLKRGHKHERKAAAIGRGDLRGITFALKELKDVISSILTSKSRADAEAERLQNDLRDQQRVIEELQSQIRNKDGDIAALQGQICTKDQLIHNLNEQLRAKNGEVQIKDREINRLRRLSILQDDLNMNQRTAIAEQATAIAEQRTAIAELQRHVNRLLGQVHAAETARDAAINHGRPRGFLVKVSTYMVQRRQQHQQQHQQQYQQQQQYQHQQQQQQH